MAVQEDVGSDYIGRRAIAPREISRRRSKAIAAAVIGNLFEWYDFAVYGYFAATFGKQFFPVANATTSLLLSFATFGIGFLARPIGAIVIGGYGDRAGRKSALMLTMVLMAIGTGSVGLLPTYDQIGMLSPVLLVLARLMQGFSVGGESGGSIAFVAEYAASNRRGFAGGLQQATLAAGLLLGSLAGVALSSTLTAEELGAWGWRVPFLLGVLIAPIGFYMRKRLEETPAFEAVRDARAVARSPILLTLRTQWCGLLQGAGIALVWSVAYYICFAYLPTYAVREFGFSSQEALSSNALALVIVIALSPVAGILSDHIGRKPLLVASCLAFGLLTYPLFALLEHFRTTGVLSIVQFGFAVALALYNGPAPAAVAEVFSTNTRYTGLSIGLNLSASVFGGFSPLAAAYLVEATGQKVAPAYFLIFCAALTFAAVLSLQESFRKAL